MPFENEQNNRSLFPFGQKSSPATISTPLHAPPPPGLLNGSSKPMRTTSTLPTGIVTGPKISPDLRSALPKLGGERAARVRDVAGRK